MTTAPLLRRLERAPAITAKTSDSPSPRWSNEWIYFCVVVAAWCFTPLIRRLIDYHNGAFNPIQITSTIPYIVTLPMLFYCFRPERIARLTPAFKWFAGLWFAVFLYGLVVAIYRGNMNAALYEATQYIVPMIMGIWLAGDEIENPRLMGRLSVIMLIFGGIVALYGVYQFVAPPPWDALWLEGGGFESMGVAEPFQIRVFSTLNASGPAGDFFAAVLVICLPYLEVKRIWIWPFVGVVGGALLLTLVRSAWIGLIVGAVVYLIMSPRRVRTVPFIVVYALLLAFLVAGLPTLLGAGTQSDLVTTRLQTFGDVDHDGSAIARTSEIQDAFAVGLEDPIGEGLGNIGSSSALSANPDTPRGNNLDSGYLARFIELGWAGCLGYLVVIFGSLAFMIPAALRQYDGRHPTLYSEAMATIIATAVALCVQLVWADAAGDAHLGTQGFVFWLAMGIGFRRLPPGTDLSGPVPGAKPVRSYGLRART
jgi:hypothetical protein